jgi:putative peptidoglycan lipid II flippase
VTEPAPEAAGPAVSLAPFGRGRAIGLAAVILMLGNLSTSALGFTRQAVIAHVFHTASTDAWFAASIVPQMFYDLTIGAAISAALIPTFTEIFERDGSEALGRTLGAVLAMAWLALAAVVVLLVLFAPPFMHLLLSAYPQYHDVVARSVDVVRVLLPSLIFLGTSAVLLSALYSMKRFTAPAFATVFYHLGIILGAVSLARPLGVLALPIGAVAGAAAQAAIQVPSLIKAGIRPRISLQLTPALRRILKLYLPVAAGLLISIIGQIIDLNFKASLGPGAISWMSWATTFTQFPIGIAVAALSFAVLPTISSDVAFLRPEQFKQTLSMGIRLVLFLAIPAAVGFLVAGTPIIRLVLQHRDFAAHDTAMTVQALSGYCLQIPFVGIDQLLIFAFYARRNTVTPMLVGVLGVAIYIVSALLLKPHLHILGLALANTLQNSIHGLVLLSLLLAAIGPFGGRPLIRGIARTLLCAAAMAAVTIAVVHTTSSQLGTATVSARLLTLTIAMLCAGISYLGCAALLRSEELSYILGLARARVGRAF